MTKVKTEEIKLEDDKAEYTRLWMKCGAAMLYPGWFKYNEDDDTYQNRHDKHEWYFGRDVRRLKELAER